MAKWIVWLGLVGALWSGCSAKSEYQELVDSELQRGVRYDSLFLGLTFGMTSQEFFDQCWDLNRQGRVMEGASNTTVLYRMAELPHPASMNFYPEFQQNRIVQMPVTFAYDAWAPWNKHLFADSLQLDVLALFKQWYGDGFIKVTHSTKGDAYVKVDGNRRITLYTDADDMQVHALFTDLTAIDH
ncbi:hypothetical protein SAMN05421823_106160 [Catalinimonas alkaloidigena]|uniref:Lipoprotein n=1 Tax=Catalinimonas alkaloidigena TaxID=1075417 RepID=A0A1G9KI04_9BACT|nr:hypothetical protein [Catalinimonas alkaloidigena]SDL49065.1 hypothetical protein SAMN05421823_106160 [Catalinimonas alkaloidigena]